MSQLKIERLIVLIADDDEQVREIIKEYLTIFGFKTFIEAKDGSEAYRYVLDTIQRIDLIISDWEMPRTDGLTLLRAVRTHPTRSQTPFIMITSQQSQEKMKITNAKKQAVDCYIIKPFRADVLKEKVIQALKLNVKDKAS
ncbi:MAG: response regulator [Bdellovibrionaceae bacterium]|nr:response regulator [Bdellovibrio sp.]